MKFQRNKAPELLSNGKWWELGKVTVADIVKLLAEFEPPK